MSAVAFVQARMASTRLPGKMLLPIAGRPLVEWVLRRVALATRLSGVVLLTSIARVDDGLARHAEALGFVVRRGSETDVLSRFVDAAAAFPADHYVRVCGDSPFVCATEIDRLVGFHEGGAYDYTFNHVPKLGNGYADGFGAEIMSRDCLERVSAAPDLTAHDREHVTQYIWRHRDAFAVGVLKAPQEVRYPDLRFDVDTRTDFEAMARLGGAVRLESPAGEIIRTYLDLTSRDAHL